ncbi:unnamed protein product [Schistosoma turkestanicum]|nr:unnamed protein product [Schistosoma turkestanicum]
MTLTIIQAYQYSSDQVDDNTEENTEMFNGIFHTYTADVNLENEVGTTVGATNDKKKDDGDEYEEDSPDQVDDNTEENTEMFNGIFHTYTAGENLEHEVSTTVSATNDKKKDDGDEYEEGEKLGDSNKNFMIKMMLRKWCKFEIPVRREMKLG